MFWTLNPRKIKPYEKAYHLKQRQQDENNFWLGRYMMLAVGAALNSDNEYPNEPILKEYYEDIDLTDEERDDKELRKMLYYEQLWHNNDVSLGLPETKINTKTNG